MPKSTGELLEILKSSDDIQKFLDKYKDDLKGLNTAEYLNILLREKDLEKSEVIKNSNINGIYAYKIFNGERKPSRSKLLCLAFGMCLDLDETQRLLAVSDCGMLYSKNPADAVVIHAITNKLSVIECNEILYENSLPVIE